MFCQKRSIKVVFLFLLFAGCTVWHEESQREIGINASAIASATKLPTFTTVISTNTTRPPSTTPKITPTFDVSNIVTRTPSQSAICPPEKPDATWVFNFDNSADWEQTVWKSMLDALNTGVSRKTILNTFIQHNSWADNRIIREVDLTADGIPELLFSFYPESFVAFVCDNGQYQAVWLPVNSIQGLNPVILEITDMNQDGVVEIVAWAGDGRSRSFTVYEWDGKQFQELNAPGPCMKLFGPSMANVRDTNGDDVMELVLEQEIPVWSEYSAGFPWRKETRICSWNGETFVLTRKELDSPEYRFQAIQDGDRLSLSGDYDKAINFYQQAVFRTELDWWSDERRLYELSVFGDEGLINPTPIPSLLPDPTESPALAAYAYYRIMLLHFVQGNLPEAQNIYEMLQMKFPSGMVGDVYTTMATIFWNEFESSKNIEQACAIVIKYSETKPMEILGHLGNGEYSKTYYGNQSLTYTPADICPFKTPP